jgi:serine/threonine protein kinase
MIQMTNNVEPPANDLKVTSFDIYGDVSSTTQQNQQQDQQQNQKQKPANASLTDRFALVRRLGKSSEGIVNLSKSVTTGQLRVMKIVKADKAEAPIEARMLGAVGRYPNVLTCFEAEYHPSGGVAIMCMEFCSLGDLYRMQRLLLDKKMLTPAALVLKVLVDVSEGLAFIHGGWTRSTTSGLYRLTRQNHQNLVHRDLKPENIFVKLNGGARRLPTFVIGDLGQAFNPAVGSHNSGGTRGYRAPEFYLHSRPPLTFKADVYSFGITMLSLCQGLEAGLYDCGTPPDHLKLPRHLAYSAIQALLRRCLAFEPKDRPDMSPAGVLWYVPGFRTILEGVKKDEIAEINGIWSPNQGTVKSAAAQMEEAGLL